MAGKLKLGIIGMGTIGNVHAQAHQAVGEAEIAAICDIDPKKLQAAGARYGVKNLFDDYRKLIAGDVEAVIVSVPNSLHCRLAVAALKAGKNVFLEKPMATGPAEAAQIVAAAKKSKGVLQIGMVWRQTAAAQVVRDYVQKGLLGEVYHIRAVLLRRRGIPGLGGWFTTKALSGGGPMIDVGVHWFDISMWLSGLWKPTSVSAKTYDKFGPRMEKYAYVDMWAGPPNYRGQFDVEDYTTGLVRFGKKATLNFEIAWASNAQDEAFVELLGTEGGVRLFDGKALTILTESNGKVADLSPRFPEQNNFHVQARKFVAACRGRGKPAATGEQGLTVIRLIDAIYASSRSNREVAIR